MFRPCIVAPVLGLAALAACLAGEEGPPPGGDPARGFALIEELACTRCHAAPGIAAEPASSLVRVGARLSPPALRLALAGGERMPDCLAGMEDWERDFVGEALTHFLVSRGGALTPEAPVVDAVRLERGRQLYHSVGCVACHEPYEAAGTLARPLWDFPEVFEKARPRPAPATPWPHDRASLRGLRQRTTLDALARTLLDPVAVHPSGRMPSLTLAEGEAADLAAYLLYEDALDAGAVIARGPGALLDYYEESFPGETYDFDAFEPVRTEPATSFFDGIARRDDQFGFRFRGVLEVEKAGMHRFWTRSDDGSMLYVDGALVVDNRGQHAPDEREGEVFLEVGEHALEVTYFEHLGGEELSVAWAPPGEARRPLDPTELSHLQARLPAGWAPFTVDPELVAEGRRLYGSLGCVDCHEPSLSPGPIAPVLADLRVRGGCLASSPRDGVPWYDLDPGARADLAAALRAGSPPELAPEERLEQRLARLDCGACHVRGALEGPSAERLPFFAVADGLDLGDEGRLPPTLERVGAKLKPAWLHAVLAGGGRARPYMRTRMPQYGEKNVAGLGELFAAADAHLRDESEPEFDVAAVEAGRELVGSRGLGCIQCHGLGGHPSLGIPAVDLAYVHERVYPGWFRELLMDPIAINMNTRMPTFWSDEGKSPVAMLDADPARQVDAMWTYLSLGGSMPLPEGLVPLPNEYEVEVLDRPVSVGVFMDGVSPRTVCVGLPERLHYAFDVQDSRLALAWRGRFLDAKGTWHGRAGQLEKPAGEDVLEFPAGPAVAVLESQGAPWPLDDGGFRPTGRTFDEEGRPRFAYAGGGLRVTESVVPRLQAGGCALVRRFELTITPDQLVVMRLATGSSIEHLLDGSWRVSGEKELHVGALPRDLAWVVERDGVSELRFLVNPGGTGPVRFEGTVKVPLEVEYSW